MHVLMQLRKKSTHTTHFSGLLPSYESQMYQMTKVNESNGNRMTWRKKGDELKWLTFGRKKKKWICIFIKQICIYIYVNVPVHSSTQNEYNLNKLNRYMV